MIVSDAIAYAMRAAGILGVGQTALAQDTADAQTALQLMLQQWRQKRWLVFRLNWLLFPLAIGQKSYTVGPLSNPTGPISPPPDVVIPNSYFRPANIQSCFLRQNVGSGPNSFPIDFPMNIMLSRQQYDSIRLKKLGSWPAAIYYDPTVQVGTLYIWPIPVQTLFSLYIAWQEAIDFASEQAPSVELETLVPAETQEAIIYNLAQRLITNYKLPPDAEVKAMAKSTLNTLRQTNYAMAPMQMPQSLRPGTRLKNPMGGFYPEVSSGQPFTTLG